MKLRERTLEARLRNEAVISDEQSGFMPRKSTAGALFALRILMESYGEGQKEPHCVFVGSEKSYNRLPREGV